MDISRSRLKSTFLVILFDLKSIALMATVFGLLGVCGCDTGCDVNDEVAEASLEDSDVNVFLFS